MRARARMHLWTEHWTSVQNRFNHCFPQPLQRQVIFDGGHLARRHRNHNKTTTKHIEPHFSSNLKRVKLREKQISNETFCSIYQKKKRRWSQGRTDITARGNSAWPHGNGAVFSTHLFWNHPINSHDLLVLLITIDDYCYSFLFFASLLSLSRFRFWKRNRYNKHRKLNWRMRWRQKKIK